MSAWPLFEVPLSRLGGSVGRLRVLVQGRVWLLSGAEPAPRRCPGQGLTPAPLSPTAAFAFYRSRRGSLGGSSRTSLPQPGPYVPQCDASGGWEPVQCHSGTGEGDGHPWEAQRCSPSV